MKIMKAFRKAFCLFSVFIVALLGLVGYYTFALPKTYYAQTDCLPAVSAGLPVSLVPEGSFTEEGSATSAGLYLFGIIPIKKATVTDLPERTVIIGGEPFGMKLFSEGVMVTGFLETQTSKGGVCPAEKGCLHLGDIILSANGKKLESNADLIQLVTKSGGEEIRLSVLRNQTALQLHITPALRAEDQTWRLDVLVKDSSAGIGTITFYDPQTGLFAGLGHPICENDTATPIPLGRGEAVPATIEGYTKGQIGEAGELQGIFSVAPSFGALISNNNYGVVGEYKPALPEKALVKVAFASQVKKGKAEIQTTLSGNTPKSYEIEIEAVYANQENNTRHLLIHVTDKSLLAQTGGILQGMSGSPILQNGMLVGAVTHVLVGDPTRGYGVFADAMFGNERAEAEEQSAVLAS